MKLSIEVAVHFAKEVKIKRVSHTGSDWLEIVVSDESGEEVQVACIYGTNKFLVEEDISSAPGLIAPVSANAADDDIPF